MNLLPSLDSRLAHLRNSRGPNLVSHACGTTARDFLESLSHVHQAEWSVFTSVDGGLTLEHASDALLFVDIDQLGIATVTAYRTDNVEQRRFSLGAEAAAHILAVYA